MNAAAEQIADIVCVHGLWMPGIEMWLLRRRLSKRHQFRTHAFFYHSLADNLVTNAERLRDFIVAKAPGGCHIVAHSLGGVVALQMLARFPDAPVARVVCLGAPLVDSRPARQLLRYRWGAKIVGRTLAEAVLDRPLGQWRGEQQVGVIAGTLPLGIARLFMSLRQPSDGVVEVAETRLPGIADHLEVRVNHTGLLLSASVAKQSAGFLRNACFDRTGSEP